MRQAAQGTKSFAGAVCSGEEVVSEMEMEQLVKMYKDRLFAAAFQICKNTADADDVVQEVFIAYYTSGEEFESEEHRKAWLFRVTINKARNYNRTFWRRNRVPFEEDMMEQKADTPETEGLFEAVMNLPEKYRIVIHLFYYEGYHVREMAKILKISESNVKVRLNRGRRLLKDWLSGEEEGVETTLYT